MRRLAFAASLVLSLSLSGCANSECNFHSQCRPHHYCLEGMCLQDCRYDLDCPGTLGCSPIGRCEEIPDGGWPDSGFDGGSLFDAGPPPPDSGPPPADGGRDTGPPPFDSGPPPTDAGPRPDSGPGPDAGPTGPGRYLDRCTADRDCMSGRCVDDVGGSRMCTRTCTAHRDCADEHVCAGGVCRRDDTGEACSTSMPATCVLGLCLGGTAGGSCTRDCTTAADCPAGYACTTAGGSPTPICVDIEQPCTRASDCLTGLCLPGVGCTSSCRSAADCPGRLSSLGPYSCRVAFGSTGPICVPPSDIVGMDPIGAACRADAMGEWMCRSHLCDTDAPSGAMCTQVCTAAGGCGPGFGCFLLDDGGSIIPVCERAGTGALGSTCASGRQCDSGLCWGMTAAYCTRICNDGLCPSDMTCMTVGGGFSLCLRP